MSRIQKSADSLGRHSIDVWFKDTLGVRTDIGGVVKTTGAFARGLTVKKVTKATAEVLGTAIVLGGAAGIIWMAGEAYRGQLHQKSAPQPIKAPAVPGHPQR